MPHFTHLAPGTLVYVLYDTAVANIVRESPDTNDRTVAQLPPRAVAEILGGPVYNDGHVFWQVRVPASGVEGWTSQGNGQDLYLRPVIEQVICPGLPTSLLQRGDRAMVTWIPAGVNNLRKEPGTAVDNVPNAGIVNGGQMIIVDGPACVDEIIWWTVETDSGRHGWIAEAKGTERYLLPVEVGYK